MTLAAIRPATLARIGLTLAAVAVAWPLWWLGGYVETWLGLDDLDVLGPLLFVFAGLTAGEFALARALPHEE